MPIDVSASLPAMSSTRKKRVSMHKSKMILACRDTAMTMVSSDERKRRKASLKKPERDG